MKQLHTTMHPIKPITMDTLEDVIPLFDQYRMFYQQPANEALARTYLSARLVHREAVIFALYGIDRAIGFTLLYPVFSSVRASKNWLLNDLFVLPAHRKQGVAEKLIHTALHFAKQDGASTVTLQTAHTNIAAQRLYEKLGFSIAPADAEYRTYIIGV